MLALARKYARLLESNGAVLQRADLNRHFDPCTDLVVLLNHARWQVEMVCRVADRIGGEVTAIRLLGSAQGLLMAAGLITVGEVWQDNTGWLDGASVRAFDATADDLTALQS